jgi:hypothetical protein
MAGRKVVEAGIDGREQGGGSRTTVDGGVGGVSAGLDGWVEGGWSRTTVEEGS